MPLPQKHIEDLFVALLSINNHSVTKTWDQLPRLRDAGLTEPKRVAGMEPDLLSARLKAAGYDRGKITDILAPRLKALMMQVDRGQLDSLADLVAAKDEGGVKKILLAIDGVGPRVAATAWMLLSSAED